MKIVLKRRKHRNGVRPVRKGTLKVNLQELPTITELGKVEENIINEYNKVLHFEGRNAYNRRIALLKSVLLMERAFRFLYSHKQINPDSLSMANTNESTPGYFKQKEFDKSLICLVCLRNCPFTDKDLSEEKLIRRCPILRCAFQDYALGKHLDNQYTLPVNQAEMTELALTLLS